MTTYTEVQFNKLPKWAQDLIRRCENSVEHMRKREAAALAAAGFADPDHDDYAVVPMSEHAVRFYLTDSQRPPYIEVRREQISGRDGVTVSCSEGLLAQPRAANAMFIMNEDR